MKFYSYTGALINLLHFTGSYNRFRCKKIIDFFTTNYDIKLPENITIVTYCDSDETKNNSMLCKQLDGAKIPYLCPDASKYVKEFGRWSNIFKPKLLLDVIDNITTDYVLSLDSADVLIQTFDDLIEKYESYNKPLLYNATGSRFPNFEIDIVHNRDKLGKFCNLNAGVLLGTTSKVKEFYQKVVEIPFTDDMIESEQMLCRMVFQDCMDWVDFDWKCKCFQCFSRANIIKDHDENYYISNIYTGGSK
jgi:hypothetical protein